MPVLPLLVREFAAPAPGAGSGGAGRGWPSPRCCGCTGFFRGRAPATPPRLRARCPVPVPRPGAGPARARSAVHVSSQPAEHPRRAGSRSACWTPIFAPGARSYVEEGRERRGPGCAKPCERRSGAAGTGKCPWGASWRTTGRWSSPVPTTAGRASGIPRPTRRYWRSGPRPGFVGSWRLEGCTRAVTVEPCVDVCGSPRPRPRAPLGLRRSQSRRAGRYAASVPRSAEDPRLNHRVEVAAGVLEAECQALLRRFFHDLREAQGVGHGLLPRLFVERPLRGQGLCVLPHRPQGLPRPSSEARRSRDSRSTSPPDRSRSCLAPSLTIRVRKARTACL
jgi:hypothetical protein